MLKAIIAFQCTPLTELSMSLEEANVRSIFQNVNLLHSEFKLLSAILWPLHKWCKYPGKSNQVSAFGSSLCFVSVLTHWRDAIQKFQDCSSWTNGIMLLLPECCRATVTVVSTIHFTQGTALSSAIWIQDQLWGRRNRCLSWVCQSRYNPLAGSL